LPEARRGGARGRSLAARAGELNRHFARYLAFFEDEDELVHWPGELFYEMRDRAVRRSRWPINLSVLLAGLVVAIAVGNALASCSTGWRWSLPIGFTTLAGI
jgi:hypothetical protein